MVGHDQDLASLGIRYESRGGDVWQPTPHGLFMAGILDRNHDLVAGLDVLELGAGMAIHTIILQRAGARSITATEYREDLLQETRRLFEAHAEGACDIRYVVADWLDVDGTYDAVVTNPPFCKSGKTNRRYFIDELILNAHKRLRPRGRLIFVQSSMADIAKTQRRLDENGFDHEIIATTEGPFRDYYYEEPGFLEEARRVPGGFSMKDGKEHETLFVVSARLRA